MKHIIIINVCGGLGNQMSQYAMYCLMKKTYPKHAVYLDISIFNQHKFHNGYELEKIFLKAQRRHLDSFSRFRVKVLSRLKQITMIEQTYQSGYPEDLRLYELSLARNYRLNGTWHNFDYRSIRNQLLHDFSFPEIADDLNLGILKEIKTTNSVSLHIRKGDYIEYGLDICDKEYYKKAMEIIEDKVPNPKYYVFSDDIEQAKEIMGKSIDCQYISNNTGSKSYIDMNLMKNCKHNIIVNSTFSYWAAWLNENPDKIVIRPSMQTRDNRTWKTEGMIEI